MVEAAGAVPGLVLGHFLVGIKPERRISAFGSEVRAFASNASPSPRPWCEGRTATLSEKLRPFIHQHQDADTAPPTCGDQT